MYTYDNISLNSSSYEKCFRQSRRVNQKAHFFNNFPPENRVVHEIMCKNIIEPDKLLMTILGLLTLCWISKTTHSAYEILLALPLQQWLHERASIYRDIHIACLVSV